MRRRRSRGRRYTHSNTRWDLRYGPFRIDEHGRSDWTVSEDVSPPVFASDGEAAAAFRALQPQVGPDDWAYWRFERGLGPSEAFSAVWAVRKREWAARNREVAAKQNMPEWSYVKKMLAKADELEREADELEAVAAGSTHR